MRVLLAEDNDLNLEIATTLLADEGVAVTCAANGREAFDAFVDRPAGSFDAILMDIMMPVMDDACIVGSLGILGKGVRRHGDNRHRPHIGLYGPADGARGLVSVGHLTKPIDMEKVKQALATARR